MLEEEAGLSLNRLCRPVEIFGHVHLLEETLGGDHVEMELLAWLGTATIDKEQSREGSFSEGSDVTEAHESELRVCLDRLLIAMSTKLRGNGEIVETVSIR